MKNVLRQKFKALRGAMSPEERARADKLITENFMRAYGGYNSFFIYYSFGTEADTTVIISALLSAGKRVLLPRVEGDYMTAVPYGRLKRGRFGTQEPEGEAFEGFADVTVVPLLAVNARGVRLGYGGGFYDRYLENAPTLKVGLGYAFQLSGENFGEEWDVPLDAFVSDKGVRLFGVDCGIV